MVENRDCKRVKLSIQIDYYSDTKGKAKNISESGLCMLTKSSLSKGMPLILKFDLVDKGCINTIGKVVRCQQIKPDIYECAVKYTSISVIDRQKIREYVYENLKDKADRRHDFRTKIDIYINYSFPVKSIVKNYNSKGLCVITKQAFEPGNMILLTLLLDENEKLHVYGKVVWCLETKTGAYKTGIKFWKINDDIRARIMVYFQNLNGQKLKSASAK